MSEEDSQRRKEKRSKEKKMKRGMKMRRGYAERVPREIISPPGCGPG